MTSVDYAYRKESTPICVEQHRGVDPFQVHVLEPLHRVFHTGGGLGAAAVARADVADPWPGGLGPEFPSTIRKSTMRLSFTTRGARERWGSSR